MASKKKVLFYIALALVILLLIYTVYRTREELGRILSPFLMAVAIAYILNPIVVRMERKGISRGASIILLYSGVFILIISSSVFVVPNLISNTKELMVTLPEIIDKYQTLFNNFVSTIRSSNWSEEIKSVLFKEIQNNATTAQNYITGVLSRSLETLIGAVTLLSDLFLAMIIAYYFIKDKEFFKSGFLSLVPRRWRNGLIGTGREVNLILANFVQGQLLTALIVGTLETIGLIIVGVKYSFVLGIIGGIANIIPYFGPIIGAVPAVALALIQSPVKALWAALVFVIVQQLDNSFISPKIIEGRLGLHPVTTILAVLLGGQFLGILGMLISVPIAAVLRVLVKRSIEAIV
jgi:predicted PurR-regulated permease PerM